MRALLILGVLFAAAGLFASGAEAYGYQRLTLASADNQSAHVYLKAKSASEPYASLDASAQTVETFQVAAAPGGPQRAVATVTGTQPAAIEFSLPSLPRTYWLNVSKAVGGILWWDSSTWSSTAQDQGYVRVEVWSGTTFIGADEQILPRYGFSTPPPFGDRKSVV